MTKAEELGTKLIFPLDFIVSSSFSEDSDAEAVDIADISTESIGMDIGPRTILYFQTELQDAVYGGTIFWNGKDHTT